MVNIKNTKELLEAAFSKGGIDDHVIHKDFVQSQKGHFTRYNDQVQRLGQHAALDFDHADLHTSFDKLKDKAEKVADMREDLAGFDGSEIIKKGKADRLKLSERDLAREAREHERVFKDLAGADTKALDVLGKEREALSKQLSKDFGQELKSLEKAIQRTKGDKLTEDIVGTHFGTIPAGTSIEDAGKLSEQYGKQYDRLVEKMDYKLEDLVTQHERLGEKYHDIAAEVKESTGHDLMAGVGRGEKEGSTILKAGEDAAKSGGGFKKIAGFGLGALVGGWVGKKMGGEDSTIAPLLGVGVGGAAGLMLAKSLAKDAVAVASHVR